MDYEEFDTFMKSAGMVMAGDAERNYRETGQRGMMVFQCRRGPIAGVYVPLRDFEMLGFSQEIVAAVMEYNPVGEAILFVLCDGFAKLIKVSADQGTLAASPLN